MSVDITVFIEHFMADEWVLFDIDPMSSSERNAERRELLYTLNHLHPEDLSKGCTYWFESDDLNFLAYIDILNACRIWHQTNNNASQNDMDIEAQLLNYFGLWQPNYEKFRVVIGV